MKSNSRHRRTMWYLDAVGFLGNGIGALLTILYVSILPEPAPEIAESTDDSMLLPILLTVGLLVLGRVLGQLYFAPLWAWHRRLAAGKVQEPIPLRVRQQALNLPVITALITMGMWLLAGLTIGGSNSGLFSGSLNWGKFLYSWLRISAIPGTVTSILVYFANERIWRDRVPLFFPEGDIHQIPSFRLNLRRRLLVLFVMGTVPLLLLAIVSYNHAAHIANLAGLQSLLPGLLQTEIFTVGIGILLAVILALTLGASLVEPVETIGRGLAAVREGNLEVEIAVTANDELGMLASGFNAMVAGLRREEVIRRMFGLYVTPEVADYAIQHGVELGGGQLTEATVMFVDIRGFTSIAEKLVPEAVIALLNRYFQAISGVVIQHGGLVNKFGGDSLLAIFGSPLNPATDHAQQAVLSAEAIVQSLEHFNQDQRRRDEPTLQVGIGLASGPVLAGNVGSTERLEYTVIGDTVNLASRLDALTKELDVPVLLTEATARAVVEGTVLQQVGEVQLRGRQEPVQVYALQGGNHQHESSSTESSVRIPRTYG